MTWGEDPRGDLSRSPCRRRGWALGPAALVPVNLTQERWEGARLFEVRLALKEHGVGSPRALMSAPHGQYSQVAATWLHR